MDQTVATIELDDFWRWVLSCPYVQGNVALVARLGDDATALSFVPDLQLAIQARPRSFSLVTTRVFENCDHPTAFNDCVSQQLEEFECPAFDLVILNDIPGNRTPWIARHLIAGGFIMSRESPGRIPGFIEHRITLEDGRQFFRIARKAKTW